MNRAARIAGMTKTGTVWCSSAAWSAAHSTAVREEHTPLVRPAGGGLDGGALTHPLRSPSPQLAQWGEPPRDTYSVHKMTLTKQMATHPEGIDEVKISDNSFREIANLKDETCFSFPNSASHEFGSPEEPTQVGAQVQSGSAQVQSGSAQVQSGSAQAHCELVEVKEAHSPSMEDSSLEASGHESIKSSIYSEPAITQCQPTMEGSSRKASDHESNNKSNLCSEPATLCQPTMEDSSRKASDHESNNKSNLCSEPTTLCKPTMEDSSQKIMSRDNLPFNDLCTLDKISCEFPQLMACPNGPRHLSPRTSPAPRTTQVGMLGHTRFMTICSQASMHGSRALPRLDVSHIPLGSFPLKGIEGEMELVQCCLNSYEPASSSATPSIFLPKLLKTNNDISTGGSTAGSVHNRMLRSSEHASVRLGPNGTRRLGPNGAREAKRSVSLKTGLGTGTSMSTMSKTPSRRLMTARAST
eukprot:gene26776-4359_t